jgi:hypothetical protein
MDHSVQATDTDGWNSKLCGAFFGSPTSVSARIRASSHSLTTSTAMDSDSDISIDFHSLQVMVLHRAIDQSLGLIEYIFPRHRTLGTTIDATPLFFPSMP